MNLAAIPSCWTARAVMPIPAVARPALDAMSQEPLALRLAQCLLACLHNLAFVADCLSWAFAGS